MQKIIPCVLLQMQSSSNLAIPKRKQDLRRSHCNNVVYLHPQTVQVSQLQANPTDEFPEYSKRLCNL